MLKNPSQFYVKKICWYKGVSKNIDMIKRLPKEIGIAQELQNVGIFYFPEEVNMNKGKAILFGPVDTPYEYIPLEFSFEFPSDYPFIPPKVNYLTNDGYTRFHPNFYIEGKVCLSILGTYSGPKWASSLNLSSVLLSLYSLLTRNPLQHEPIYEKANEMLPKCLQYSEFVEHNLIQLFFRLYDTYKKIDDDEFQTLLENNKKILIEKVIKKAQNQETLYTVLPYAMSGSTRWKLLAKNFV